MHTQMFSIFYSMNYFFVILWEFYCDCFDNFQKHLLFFIFLNIRELNIKQHALF